MCCGLFVNPRRNPTPNPMLHQIRYRFRFRPSARDIEEARKAYEALDYCPRCGQDLDTVGCGYCSHCKWEAPIIEPMRWDNKRGSTTRKAIHRGYIGHAGIVKQYGAPNLLLCDFDYWKTPSVARLWYVLRILNLRPVWIRLDRTRRGWHAIIKITARLRPETIVAIQFALGSDRKRETYNLARVRAGKAGRTNRWNLLFEEKIT